MHDHSAVIDSLRAARGEVDLVARLKEGSLETRRDRIAEALQDPEWDAGPAELVATYPHHVVAKKEGVLMRIAVHEDEDTLRFGKPEIFSIPTPVPDVSAEIHATAAAAAELVVKEDYENAAPMIRGIAATLDVKGDLQRRLSMDVAMRSLGRKTWWQDIVNEQFASEVSLPAPRTEGGDARQLVAESINDLLGSLKESIASAAKALSELADNDKAHAGAVECARDIAEDLKSAVTVLSDVNRSDEEEMTRVYETVGRALPRLLAGVKFIEHLTKSE